LLESSALGDMVDQYAPDYCLHVLRPPRRVVRYWSTSEIERACEPRNGLVAERPVAGDGPVRSFEQVEGPFTDYHRSVEVTGDRVVDVTTYRLDIPWFGWLFRWPVRSSLRRHAPGTGAQPAWAPPDRLEPRHVVVLGLLAAVSMPAAFVNTLFTQTVNFAADDFGISEQGQGIAGVIVRFGIVLALPFAVLADRLGRRRMIVLLAWLAPTLASLGALAPNFWVLTASQAVARPLGIALDLLIAVAAAEEMPRNSRAYAVSVLAMASGLGAGIAVMALPLADIGPNGWRFVYVVSLVWMVSAVTVSRRLTETPRFEHIVEVHQVGRAHVDKKRFAIIASVAFMANLFIAPASYFQNRYLADVRGFSASTITIFTLTTATPASLGFVLGGRLADTAGRRRVLAFSIPLATAGLVTSFIVGGIVMWAAAFVGGLLAGVAYPALSVYRTELFPTARRGQAGGFIVAMALIGGSVGLLLAGHLIDRGWSYGATMGLLACAQLVTATVVYITYPETAHRSLEEINPEDA
jgi:MFS family permease